MAKLLTTILLLAIFAGLILLALNSWRRRRREQSMVFSEPAKSLEASELAGSETVSAQYVATTITDEPLNRVSAYGLGFRGRATITSSEAGILIDRKGERALAIAGEQIKSVNFEQAVIGRAVEKDGLVAINWLQDNTALTTVLRFNSAADRNRILGVSKALSRKAI